MPAPIQRDWLSLIGTQNSASSETTQRYKSRRFGSRFCSVPDGFPLLQYCPEDLLECQHSEKHILTAASTAATRSGKRRAGERAKRANERRAPRGARGPEPPEAAPCGPNRKPGRKTRPKGGVS